MYFGFVLQQLLFRSVLVEKDVKLGNEHLQRMLPQKDETDAFRESIFTLKLFIMEPPLYGKRKAPRIGTCADRWNMARAVFQ